MQYDMNLIRAQAMDELWAEQNRALIEAELAAIRERNRRREYVHERGMVEQPNPDFTEVVSAQIITLKKAA